MKQMFAKCLLMSQKNVGSCFFMVLRKAFYILIIQYVDVTAGIEPAS
jgi:hypothetical protein